MSRSDGDFDLSCFSSNIYLRLMAVKKYSAVYNTVLSVKC